MKEKVEPGPLDRRVFRCDFCFRSPPAWEFPAKGFPWTACLGCYALIQTGNKPLLLERAMTGVAQEWPKPGRTKKALRVGLEKLHAKFFAERLNQRAYRTYERKFETEDEYELARHRTARTG